MRIILRDERKKSNLTQEQLANIVGISRVHYNQIENSSSKNPSLEVAINIKKALNYESDDLFLISNVPNGNK